MTTYSVYGKMYGRGTETIEQTISQEQLETLIHLNDTDEDAFDEYLEEMDWSVYSIITGGMMEDGLDLTALLNGETQKVRIEEYTAAIATSVNDAKLAFIDIDE